MAVAVKFHFFDPFCAVKALPTVFLGIYTFLIITGGGRFSLDNFIFRNFKDGEICGSDKHYALRIALMAAAFCISWFVFGNIFNLGGVCSAIALLAALALFILSIYGILPNNKVCGK